MRMTRALIAVASALMDDPTGRHWGYALSKSAGVRSGAMYPILNRLLEAGWLADGWEDPRTLPEKRPPRRYYELTDVGCNELGSMVRTAQGQIGTRTR